MRTFDRFDGPEQFDRHFNRAKKGFFAVAAFAIVAWLAGIGLVGALIWAVIKFLGRH